MDTEHLQFIDFARVPTLRDSGPDRGLKGISSVLENREKADFSNGQSLPPLRGYVFGEKRENILNPKTQDFTIDQGVPSLRELDGVKKRKHNTEKPGAQFLRIRRRGGPRLERKNMSMNTRRHHTIRKWCLTRKRCLCPRKGSSRGPVKRILGVDAHPVASKAPLPLLGCRSWAFNLPCLGEIFPASPGVKPPMNKIA